MSDARKTAILLAVGGAVVFGVLEGSDWVDTKGDVIRDAGSAVKCARKLPDSGCMRLLGYIGETPKPQDPGDLNQFPAADAVGDCEIIDCEIEVR